MPINTQYYASYDGKQSTALTWKPTIDKPKLAEFFKIVEGVKGKQAVYFIDPIEMLTILDPGCGLGASQVTLNITGKYFSPKDLKIWKWECWKDLRGKVFEWNLKSGNKKHELDIPDYEDYMIKAISNGGYADLLRMAWFADSEMTSDKLANPDELDYYRTFDGAWKRVFTGVGAGKIGRIPITENNYATNNSQKLAEGAASKYLDKVWKKQSRRMKAVEKSRKKWYVTQEIYENYEDERLAAPNIEKAYVSIAEGIQVLQYRGIPLTVVDEWDIRIASSFTKAGAGADRPNRIMLVVQDNLQLLFDTNPYNTPDEQPLEVWNDQKDEKWNARLKYVADMQLADEEYIVVAY